MELTYTELDNLLQNLTNKRNIQQAEIARSAELSRGTVNYRKQHKNVYFTDFEVEKAIKYFCKKYNVEFDGNYYLSKDVQTEYENAVIGNIIKDGEGSSCPYRMEHNCPCTEQFEIHYIDELPEEARLPEITSLHVDMELVVNHWQRKPENLRIIPMQGDNLSSYFYPCKNRDILIVDIESTIATREGLYVYSAHNNTMLFVGKLWQGMDGTIKIERFEANGEVTEKFITPEKQKEVDFRILARVVKNASLSL